MARVKKVFSRQDTCAARWIAQIQPEGCCRAFGHESIYFSGDTIYSRLRQNKSVPIAKFRGKNVVFVSSTYRSSATNVYHKPAVMRELRKYPEIKLFAVPDDMLEADPVKILPGLIARHAVDMERVKKSRGRIDWWMKYIDKFTEQIKDFAQYFNLPVPDLAMEKGLESKLRYRMAKSLAKQGRERMERGW